MKAMILAAGFGKRMGSLTKQTPKPLLRVQDTPLIVHHLRALAKAGIKKVIINVHYLKEQIISQLGDGKQFGLSIQYSVEQDCLETGGGIKKVLPLMEAEHFVVVSADIWTDYDFKALIAKPVGLAHLVMVDNPDFHPSGDFSLHHSQITLSQESRLTFGNVAMFHPDFFIGSPEGAFRLGDWLREKIPHQQVTGEYFNGTWVNVGTEEQLDDLNKELEC